MPQLQLNVDIDFFSTFFRRLFPSLNYKILDFGSCRSIAIK